MRITNKMLSNNFLRDMRTNLNNLSTIQTQMATGKQINKPSDDPAKASKIMQMYSEIDANKQYNENITNTSNWLDMTDSTLGQVGSVTTRIQELLVSAGKAGYGPDEKAAIKYEINQKVGELSQMLNTTFDGKYIFGGTSGTSRPVGTIDVDGDTELISNVKSQVVAKITDGAVTPNYGGKTVAAKTDAFNITLNGFSMPVTTTSDITSGTTKMADTASMLQTNIQSAIDLANTGKTDTVAGFIKPVTVTAAADGRFVVNSPSGTITFSDNTGETTTKDLGLNGGPKDTLLVEISQGVTMDYNVTASQVINYGEGDNNLINLLANITKHLGSDVATDISALNNADLKGIQDFATNVLKLRSEVGAKQNSMDSALARNSDQNTNMTEILSKTEDIDITEKAMEYATMQTIYMAALQTSAKVIQPSLLDYLK